MLIRFTSKPIMPIEVDLNGKGKSRGDADMHESELPVNEIKIQAQTLSWGIDEMGSIFPVGEFEALAGFHSAEHTYEPICDSIPIGDLSSFFLLSNPTVDMNVGSFTFFSHGFDIFFNPLGVFSANHLEIL
jgi:hypothetical protein